MKHEQFIELTKAQKLALPYSQIFKEVDVTATLFILLRKKVNGYGASAVFIKTKDSKWLRVHDYDCFSFITGGHMLRGDFEHGGIVFFLGENWRYSYGANFTFREKHNKS